MIASPPLSAGFRVASLTPFGLPNSLYEWVKALAYRDERSSPRLTQFPQYKSGFFHRNEQTDLRVFS
jgi:hypothetical protein